ncbi:hypothetical protein KBY93_12335 [Synechococcus sp. J7-Johnson]|nr:hypothetical protein [Synechococcus sp. J7-Johnson]
MTLEDLDQPTPAWEELERDRLRSGMPGLDKGWPGRRSPAMRYPGAGEQRRPRNLAREWIEDNPKQWEALMRQALEEEARTADIKAAADRAGSASGAPQPASRR